MVILMSMTMKKKITEVDRHVRGFGPFSAEQA